MLNLIKLIINRAIERIVSLVSVRDVVSEAANIAASDIDTDALIESVIEHERVKREFHNLTSRMVARHVDLGDLASEIDLTDLASGIDAADVAGNIDLGDLAGEIDLGDFAESLDYERLAAALDIDRLSNALDVARRTEPTVEQSPDLITRLLDLAVEKLLARADEAANNGEV